MSKYYACKICDGKTTNPKLICSHCEEKLKLWSIIQAMLAPYARKKNEVKKDD